MSIFEIKNLVVIGGEAKGDVSLRMFGYLPPKGTVIDDLLTHNFFGKASTIFLKNDLIYVLTIDGSNTPALNTLIITEVYSNYVAVAKINYDEIGAGEGQPGIISVATEEEAKEGTNDTTAISPLKLKQVLELVIADFDNKLDIMKSNLQDQIDLKSDNIYVYEQLETKVDTTTFNNSIANLNQKNLEQDTNLANLSVSVANEVARAVNKETELFETKQPKVSNDNKEYVGKNGAWVETTDIKAQWGQITGDISLQGDLAQELTTIQDNVDNLADSFDTELTAEKDNRISADNILQNELNTKLETVATDGTTIFGTGTTDDPITTTQP